MNTEGKMPEIDPDALYTVEQAARKLMVVDPSLSFEEAYREVCMAIDSGKLTPHGYLHRS